MKTFLIQAIFLTILVLGAFYLTTQQGIVEKILARFQLSPKPDSPVSETIIKIGEVSINAEVADNSEKRSKGLSNRDNLDPDSGMLFVFDKVGNNRFWMKGMKFPIDFIWIKDDVVIDLLPNVPVPIEGTRDDLLPLYASQFPINKVLEVNAGFVASHNIKIGDKVEIVNK